MAYPHIDCSKPRDLIDLHKRFLEHYPDAAALFENEEFLCSYPLHGLGSRLKLKVLALIQLKALGAPDTVLSGMREEIKEDASVLIAGFPKVLFDIHADGELTADRRRQRLLNAYDNLHHQERMLSDRTFNKALRSIIAQITQKAETDITDIPKAPKTRYSTTCKTDVSLWSRSVFVPAI